MAETTGWENFYALGWYTREGRAMLTTWNGDLPVVAMLSVDCPESRIPIWDAPVPPDAKLLPIPLSPDELATLVRERNARRVFGWILPEPVDRRAPTGQRTP